MSKEDIWTPDRKLSYLPEFPKDLFLKEAEKLYQDLLDNRLKVVLIPATEQKHHHHMIRIAISYNPFWYSLIYYSHHRGRRKDFEKSLWRIVNGNDGNFNQKNNKYNYDAVFRHMIYSRFTEGYVEEDGSRIFPDNKIRNFFGLDSVEIPEEYKEEHIPL